MTKITEEMRDALREIEHTGTAPELDLARDPLAFSARERTLAALRQRGLIRDGVFPGDLELTEKGVAALRAADGAALMAARRVW